MKLLEGRFYEKIKLDVGLSIQALDLLEVERHDFKIGLYKHICMY